MGSGFRSIRIFAATRGGRGTYQLRWAKNRPYRFTVIDAHSLYIEVLGEFGLVGFLLIGGALIAVFVGLARRVRGEDRHLYAAVLALGAVWAVHAGIDWDWEMPAVTLWLFALAGLGLSKPVSEGARAGLLVRAGADGADRRRGLRRGPLDHPGGDRHLAVPPGTRRWRTSIAANAMVRSTRRWARSTRSRCGRSPTR